MSQAFPLQLGQCWQAANAVASDNEDSLLEVWLIQVTACTLGE